MGIPIVRLEMAIDGYVEYLREPLTSSREAAGWAERNIIRHSNREQIIVVCCDASGRATAIDMVGKGSVNACMCSIPEIFKVAIISNAVGIILFHNHPSGDPFPSQKDREITRAVREAGEMLEIELLDHIIIGGRGSYYSFMEDNDISSNSEDG